MRRLTCCGDECHPPPALLSRQSKWALYLGEHPKLEQPHVNVNQISFHADRRAQHRIAWYATPGDVTIHGKKCDRAALSELGGRRTCDSEFMWEPHKIRLYFELA